MLRSLFCFFCHLFKNNVFWNVWNFCVSSLFYYCHPRPLLARCCEFLSSLLLSHLEPMRLFKVPPVQWTLSTHHPPKDETYSVKTELIHLKRVNSFPLATEQRPSSCLEGSIFWSQPAFPVSQPLPHTLKSPHCWVPHMPVITTPLSCFSLPGMPSLPSPLSLLSSPQIWWTAQLSKYHFFSRSPFPPYPVRASQMLGNTFLLAFEGDK